MNALPWIWRKPYLSYNIWENLNSIFRLYTVHDMVSFLLSSFVCTTMLDSRSVLYCATTHCSYLVLSIDTSFLLPRNPKGSFWFIQRDPTATSQVTELERPFLLRKIDKLLGRFSLTRDYIILISNQSKIQKRKWIFLNICHWNEIVANSIKHKLYRLKSQHINKYYLIT